MFKLVRRVQQFSRVHGHLNYNIDFTTNLNVKDNEYQTRFFTILVSEKKKKKEKSLKVNYKGILVYEILMDCVARKRMQKTTSNYLKWFPRYCDLNFYKLSH